LNLAHPTSFCSRIIEIAGEPTYASSERMAVLIMI
jgi:hypothetical protein